MGDVRKECVLVQSKPLTRICAGRCGVTNSTCAKYCAVKAAKPRHSQGADGMRTEGSGDTSKVGMFRSLSTAACVVAIAIQKPSAVCCGG